MEIGAKYCSGNLFVNNSSFTCLKTVLFLLVLIMAHFALFDNFAAKALRQDREVSRVRDASSEVVQNVLIWKWFWHILYNKLVVVGTCSLPHVIIQIHLHLSELAKDKFMCTHSCCASLRNFVETFSPQINPQIVQYY